MKLAYLIDKFDHYILLSNLCNDQLINLLRFLKVGFQNLGFLIETLCSSQFYVFNNVIELFSIH